MKKTIYTFFLLVFICLSSTSYAQYSKIYDFKTTGNGAFPGSSLISDGTFLYGMTAWGGTNNMGTIFKVKQDGTGYVKLLDFAGINGNDPNGSLISDGTFLYGMTGSGGTNDMGAVFKIKLDGTGFIKLLDFANTTNGRSPLGSLILDGTYLYGMTSNGGTNDDGTIFKIKYDGTGFVKLFDFNNDITGRNPYGSLISDDTFLYGMTKDGGPKAFGTIFKIRTNGTGYVNILEFEGGNNGEFPFGSLISDATFLYGMTTSGGTNDKGIIFKIKYDGTGFVKLLNFDLNTTGGVPDGTLISDGTFLFGMTTSGGANGNGTIFKIKLNGTGFEKLFDFSNSADGRPSTFGSLFSDGTYLFGMTTHNVSTADGTIFKYKISPNSGIESVSLKNNAIQIYPNPSNGIVTINSRQDIANINVYDITGKAIHNQEYANKLNQTEIDLSTLNNGIYFIAVQSANGEINKSKIVLVK